MSELVFIEKCESNSVGGDSTEEFRRLCVALAEERGTTAAVVARDESGKLLTPPGFADSAIDVSEPGGRTVACRRPTGDTWLPLDAVDYISEYWLTAIYTDPERYGALEGPARRWLYVDGAPTVPVWDGHLARLGPSGSMAVFVDGVPPIARGAEESWLWRHDVDSGARAPLAELPPVAAFFADLSISGDERWVLVSLLTPGSAAGDPCHRALLISLETGAGIYLPQEFRAACWHPAEGASTLLAVQGTESGPSTIGYYDLATGEWSPMCVVDTRLDAVDVSVTGRIAAVMNAPEEAWFSHTVVVVDPETGSYEPVLPRRFRCGPHRVTWRPRWVRRHRYHPGPVVLPEGMVSQMTRRRPGDGDDASTSHLLGDWLERLDRRLRTLRSRPDQQHVLPEARLLATALGLVDPSFAAATQRELDPAAAGTPRSGPGYTSELDRVRRELATVPPRDRHGRHQPVIPADSNDDAVADQAKELVDAGKVEEAEDLLRRASAGGSALLTGLLAGLLYDHGELAESELLYRQASAAGNSLATFGLAGLLAERGELAEAEALHRRAAATGVIEAMFNLANILSRRGDLDEAESWYRRAAESGQPDAMINLGLMLAERGDKAEAETWYRRAADAGLVADALSNLGNLALDRGEPAAAEALFRQAADAGDNVAVFNLALMLRMRGELPEAEALFRRSLATGDTDAAFHLAGILAVRGELAEAERLFRTAAANGNVDALRSLSVMAAQRGDAAEADALYRRYRAAGGVS